MLAPPPQEILTDFPWWDGVHMIIIYQLNINKCLDQSLMKNIHWIDIPINNYILLFLW